MRVIISAAGTGGHINPGIAIANKIKEEEPNSKIIFVGTSRGLENNLVPRAGYELKHINAYGFERKISIDNFKKVCKTIHSIKEAKKIIEKFRPDVVIGTGGYICLPVAIAAKKKYIPVILHESNAFPGIAVKLLSKKVDAILLGFEDAKKRVKNAKKIVVTGTPTKVKKINISDERKKQLISIENLKENLPIVLCFGGSQGAKSINESLMQIILEKMNEKYQIIWAVGLSQYEDIKEELKQKQIDIDRIKNARIVPYIYNMEEIMNISDLIISRSGAMTITEIANSEKPAIFIPYPYATENHQEYNAKVLANIGAAKIILNKDLNSNSLNKMILSLIENPEILKDMGKKAGKVSINNAEQKIFNEIKKITKNNL